MDWKKINAKVYNDAADDLAAYYDGIGVRTEDIDRTFNLCDKENPSVFEIACGNGRDASYILTKANKYLGMDLSDRMVELARKKDVDGVFVQGNIEDFDMPKDIDIVFAFASLLHTEKGALRSIFENLHESLNQDGVIFISLKMDNEYESYIKKDEYGEREFILYTPEVMASVTEDLFVVEWSREDNKQNVAWLDVILKKN